MSDRVFKINPWHSVIVLTTLCTVLSLSAPLLHTYVEGPLASGEFFFCAYDFLHLTPFAIVPFVIPVLLAALFFAKMSRTVKTGFLLLFVPVNAVCFAESVRAGAAELLELGGGAFRRLPYLWLYPMLFSALAVLLFCLWNRREPQ